MSTAEIIELPKLKAGTPQLQEYDPHHIPMQIAVLRLVRRDYDFNQGPLELLLSGSIGSAKSLLVAHIIVTHALMYSGAGVLVGRRTGKDLKNTIWQMMLKHCPMLRNFWNKAEMTIRLPNGSVIYGVSWDDGNYDKFRSYELSLAVIEELTENKDQGVYDEIRDRVGRAPGVPENLIICATNPDSPQHWAYKYFIESKHPSIRCFYSKTKDNPFLPPWYYPSLMAKMDPKRARRMLNGEWIELYEEMIYYCFGDHNRIKGYEINPKYPIHITWDFNIGDGKPMSAICFQQIDKRFYFFKEFVVDGSRTLDILEEMHEVGLFITPTTKFIINGDAAGKHSDTRSRKSDYKIIADFMSNYEWEAEEEVKGVIKMVKRNLTWEMDVPLANPPIRTRHNTMNTALKNALGEVTLFVDENCPTAIEGLRLTALKKGADIIEDDSKRYQHVTTAMGYAVVRILKKAANTGLVVRRY